MLNDRFEGEVQSWFQGLSSGLNGQAAGPLHLARKNALEKFLLVGIPTPRSEEWKYTNVTSIFSEVFGSLHSTQVDTDPLSMNEVEESLGELFNIAEAAILIVVVNGKYQPQLSTPIESMSGFTIEALNDDLVSTDERIRKVLGSVAVADSSLPFVSLNSAFTDNGVVLRVNRGSKVELPVHVAMISDGRKQRSISFPRMLILSDTDSEVDVVESQHTLGEHPTLSVAVSEAILSPNSRVRYHKICDGGQNLQHIGYTSATVDHGALFTSHAISIGGGFVRNDLVVRLAEPAAETHLYGLSVLNQNEYADNHTVVDHLTPHCHSEELYKGVYDGASTGVFNGKIFVRPKAQKTTAYQSNHTILLSDKAQVNVKPQLEIWADDVKCSHGATTGQLNEDAIFYLRARGMDRDTAKALMTYAFAAEVVQHINYTPLRVLVEKRIATKLGSEPILQ